MFTFRASITFAVLAFIVALSALLIFVQYWTFQLAAEEAASARMDAASALMLGRLRNEISDIASLVRVLATSSSVADSDERSETGRAIPLFKAALREVPQMDSIYVGYDNGAWLQVRTLPSLKDEQRARLRAPMEAAFGISLIRPNPDGELPMRRIFEDSQGNEVQQFDLWKYGFDPRNRFWYGEALKADRAVISSPYVAFSIGAPVLTVSAPLKGKVRGVIAADLKLDDFSDFVQEQRPGEHGTALIFDSAGTLIAHPDFAQFVLDALTHPSHPQMVNIKELGSGPAASVLKGWDGGDRYDGSVRDERGLGFLFRLRRFTLSDQFDLNVLTLARQDDFVSDIRKLQQIGLFIAILASAAFVPCVWLFGSRMSRSLKAITAQARKLQILLSGDDAVERIKDMTHGQGASVVLDMVGADGTLRMAAQVARVLGHVTIVGLGGGALPVNFFNPPHECSVAAPYWGSITELMEVVSLAQAGKIKMLVEHFPLDRAGEAYHLLHDGKIRGRAVITPND